MVQVDTLTARIEALPMDRGRRDLIRRTAAGFHPKE
jgi:hypothetical protein